MSRGERDGLGLPKSAAIFADPSEGKTVEDLCAEHIGRLRNRIARRLAKPRSLEDLERIYRRLILPEFGHVQLADLKGEAVEKWHAEISKRAPILANRAAQALKTAWRMAEKYGWVDPLRSPLDWVELNPETPRPRILTPAERGRMLAYLEECEKKHWRDRLAARAILLLYLTGARKNEIFQLRWSEIDFNAAPAELKLRDSKTGPKTIALTDAAVAVLKRVFKSARGERGKVFPGLNYRRVFYPMREAIGVPDFTLHDLRRTFCSILAEAGVPAEDVAAVIGQRTVQVQIRHYRHLSADRRHELAEKANALLCERKN